MPVSRAGVLREARFVERKNRFVVRVQLEDTNDTVPAHLPNPGRLGEFLHDGTPYLVRKRPDARPDQATQHSVVAAKDGRFHVGSDLALGQAPGPGERDWAQAPWVVLDTHLANRLVEDALTRGVFDDVFSGRSAHRAEPAAHEGRFDFAIEADAGTWMVEVKSVTLIGTDGVTALFPDAPTKRGTRHVEELARRAREGQPAALVFLAMREDPTRVAPNTPMDPAFADALANAKQAGVDVTAYRIHQVDAGFKVAERLEVRLDPGDAATGIAKDAARR